MMQALERTTAVFCMACVCAELVSRFVGQGWGQKCIKVVAGLYILVALTEILSGAEMRLPLPALPHTESVSVGTLENAVLIQTEEELAAALEERCSQETGVSAALKITLTRTEDEIKAESVEIVLPDRTAAAERQRIAELLMEELQVPPEDLIWELPGGEDMP